MFEVTKFEPPLIFVTSRRTGETYSFLIENNGALSHEGAWFSKARERLFMQGGDGQQPRI
jgi:hypothetical protein